MEGAKWALARRTDRTYISRTFALDGMLSRYVYRVFDESAGDNGTGDRANGLEWTEQVVKTTQRGRTQIKLRIGREAGQVRELRIEQVTTSGAEARLEPVLILDRAGASRLIELVQALKSIPVEGGERSVRIDDETLRDFSTDPDGMVRLYKSDADKFRQLIRNDPSAEDLVALAHRKKVVRRFRQLLTDRTAFAQAQAEIGKGPEAVWQKLLEQNPWILGISLAGQLLQSWDDEKLEQVVAGSSIAGPGKRADAVLRTSGRIRSLVFAEIKHHETELLARKYRSGCWPPSPELVAGVTQAQQTVDRAVSAIGKRFADTDEEGAETGEATWLIRPRSFLILGRLDELRGDGGVHREKHQSFELYRRNLYEPEIITFDELLARAEWHVHAAEQEDSAEQHEEQPWYEPEPGPDGKPPW